MRKVTAIFTIIGFIVPYTVLGMFVLQNGLNLPLLLSQIFETHGSTFFALDVILCSLFIIILSFSNKALGIKRCYVISAALFIGPSCALPLYFLLKK